MEEKHDIHDFLISAKRDMQNEYDRIMKRATEDPGTAGDQGEENWATLLKNWLPSYFHIVAKGRILCDNGYASPQGEKSKPVENIESALWEADQLHIDHPIQQLDFITVSDLAAWQSMKIVFLSPKWPHYNDEIKKIYGDNGSGTSSYVCAAIGAESQKEFFTPISVLLAGLFSKLSWIFNDMRELDSYFRKVNMMGSGQGRMRLWPITIYSEGIRNRIYNGQLSNGVPYDEWHCAF